jgi:GH15 family glucan-1,4-alpha-glucosidase
MSALAEPSGGYRRVTGDTSYEKHEFLFIDFLLARALLREGRVDEVMKIVDRLVARSVADHGNIPEMEVSVPDDQFPGRIGDPTGAIPMVGYGAGIYTLFLLERAAASNGSRSQ